MSVFVVVNNRSLRNRSFKHNTIYKIPELK